MLTKTIMGKDLHSQSLDLLRFPLAIIIVAVHVFNKESIIVQDKIYDVSNISLYNDFLLFVDGFLRGISVPVYFFISGYVFFLGVNKFTTNIYLKKLRNRVYTLLIPFIIWNTFYIVIELAKYVFNGMSSFQTFGLEVNFTIKNFLSCFWQYNGELFVPITTNGEKIISASLFPINTPLWFIRDLMIVVLFTPMINYLIKHTKFYLLLVLAIISFIPNLHIPFISAFLYFSIGAYLSIYNKNMVEEFGRLFKISMIIYPLFSFLAIIATKYELYNNSQIFKQISVFGFLVLAYNVSIFILKYTPMRAGKILSHASFFIYVAHTLVFARVTKVLFMLVNPDNGIETIFTYTLSVTLTILSLLLVFMLMKKRIPRILQFVTGRK